MYCLGIVSFYNLLWSLVVIRPLGWTQLSSQSGDHSVYSNIVCAQLINYSVGDSDNWKSCFII